MERKEVLIKDNIQRIEEIKKEVEKKQKKIRGVNKVIENQEIKIEGQNQERNFLAKKMEECEMMIRKHNKNFKKQEELCVDYEKKLKNKISLTVRKKLVEDVNEYKFKIYESKFFK